MDNGLEASQQALFLVLGRSLVRVQSIELVLKRMLASRSFGGTVEDLEVWLTARHADYATNTLGTLVNELLDRFLVSENRESKEAPDPPDGTRIYLSFENVVTMEDARLLEMRSLFKGIVAARNDSVHHLAELFPLKTFEGCRDALAFVESLEAKLKSAWEELSAWADAREKAAQVYAEFMRSPQFNDYLLDGILPDGSVQWEVAGIVRALRQAAASRAEDDWMRLEDGIAWIRRESPTQTPSRYRCATYRQAIHESRAFDVKREPGPDGALVFMYRPKQ